MKRDNLHYSHNKLLSYNKPFNFVISEREAGKTTDFFNYLWGKFKQGYTAILFRRRVIDITAYYINDSMKVISKFNDEFEASKIKFNKGDVKEGVVDIYYDKKLFIRVVGLSKPLYALKGLFVENLATMVFDEFICNMRLGEKYLKDEAFKFQEVFNTFQREAYSKGINLRAIFMGNPYSLYNPYFTWLGIDTSKLIPGNFIVGETFVIEVYTLKEELKQLILKRNPLYKFDNAYTRYAFNGEAINDSNIRILKTKPNNYQLQYAFRISDKLLGIYENQDYEDFNNRFYVEPLKSIGSRRETYCFDFNDLQNRTTLVSLHDKVKFTQFKNAFRNREIDFYDLSCYYLLEEIYVNI